MSAKAFRGELNVSEPSAPDRIVAAATKLFASKGYDGTSTKDICEATNANIAAIRYHFSSKEGLYLHIIESFAGTRLNAVQRILTPPRTSEEFRVRLELFLGESLHACILEPELCKIIQAEAELLYDRSAMPL